MAAAVVVATLLADTYPLLVGLIALTLAIGAYAGALRRLASLLKVLVPLAAIMLLLQTVVVRTGTPIAAWITTDGLVTGSKACLRLLSVAMPLILMLSVTKMGDLANACVEVLHVPYRYAFTFTTALRFVPVFSQEMTAIMEAQTARGVEYDTRNPIRKLQLMLPLCVPLLVSSVGKTDATSTYARARAATSATRSLRATGPRWLRAWRSSHWASRCRVEAPPHRALGRAPSDGRSPRSWGGPGPFRRPVQGA